MSYLKNTMSTGSLPGVKRPGCGADQYSTEVEGSVELYICSPSGPLWPVLGRPLPLPYLKRNVVVLQICSA